MFPSIHYTYILVCVKACVNVCVYEYQNDIIHYGY